MAKHAEPWVTANLATCILIDGDYRGYVTKHERRVRWTAWNVLTAEETSGRAKSTKQARKRAEEWIAEKRGRHG